MKIINYAHRGASEYAPENTFSAFYLGLAMGADGIETDIRRSKDGVPVLFHDDTLMRVTGEAGAVNDYTYERLLEMRVRSRDGKASDVIVSLEDFLKYMSHRSISFAFELKEPGLAADVVALIEKYGAAAKSVITSFEYELLCEVKSVCRGIRLGYLVVSAEGKALERAVESGFYQICPRADGLTPENTARLHGMGFNVRAWGASDLKLMRRAATCGVDGMTVNFPDKLTELLSGKNNRPLELTY